MEADERLKLYLGWCKQEEAEALKVEGYEWIHTGGGCSALVRRMPAEPGADFHFEFWFLDDMSGPKEWAHGQAPSMFTEEINSIGFYKCAADGAFLEDEPLELLLNLRSESELRAFEQLCFEQHAIKEAH
jgi:hypothetical protein